MTNKVRHPVPVFVALADSRRDVFSAAEAKARRLGYRGRALADRGSRKWDVPSGNQRAERIITVNGRLFEATVRRLIQREPSEKRGIHRVTIKGDITTCTKAQLE